MFIGYILVSNFIKQSTCHDEWVKHIFKGCAKNGITLLTDLSSHHTQTRHEAQRDLLLFSDLSASRGVFKSFSRATASPGRCCSRWGVTGRGGQYIWTGLVVRLWKVPNLLTNISSLSMSGKCSSHSSSALSCCLFEPHRACFSELIEVAGAGDSVLLWHPSVPDCTASLAKRWWGGVRQTKRSQVKWGIREALQLSLQTFYKHTNLTEWIAC